MNMISIIEDCLDSKAVIKYLGMQMGDVKKTYADINHAKNLLRYNPTTNISEGIKKFIDWFKIYKKIS